MNSDCILRLKPFSFLHKSFGHGGAPQSLQFSSFSSSRPLRWPGDLQRKSGRFAFFAERSDDSRESPETCDPLFLVPAPQKRGSLREPSSDSRESGDVRESANRFARIGPSKHRHDPRFSTASPSSSTSSSSMHKPSL